MKYLCFDIGGTALKYGIYDENATLIHRFAPLETRNISYKLETIILDTITEVQESFDINGVGISTAGVVNHLTGQVVYSGGTIQNYGNPKYKEIIEEKFEIPCVVENDVNAAALGEMWKGSLKDVTNGVMLTLGTGIGGAIILESKLYRGSTFSAGEIGYMKLDGSDFQKLSAASILTQRASKVKNKDLNGIEVFEYIKNKDQEVIEVLESVIESLVKGLLNIMYLFNPEKIVLGGGILAQYDVMLPYIKEYIEKHQESSYFTQTKIAPAKLGNDAGMIGILFELTSRK